MKLLKNSNIGVKTGTYTNCHEELIYTGRNIFSFNESNVIVCIIMQ